MRLWHKFLISSLPREQLVSQWRELSSIATLILKNGTPNHILVNFVTEFDYDHFISFAYYVREEMKRRGYRTTNAVWEKIESLKPNYHLLPFGEVYDGRMNDLYLTICYTNLYEKFACGGIKESDFLKIKEVYDNSDPDLFGGY